LSQTKFSLTAADWDARYLASQSVWSLEPNQFVVAELESLEPGYMVDLAGGEGRNALWFAKRGWQVENVEFSGVALKKFEERALEQGLAVKSHQADARIARFAQSPDLVVVAYLQLPWADLKLALDNALDQQEQGVIFGVWHARENLREGFGGPQSIAVLPSVEQLEDWLCSHGLQGRVELRRRDVVTEAGVKVAIDVTLLVRR
jgi:SAM-dependent methyltransferase